MIYDSLYGNTAKIAEIIANVFRELGDVTILKVGEAQVELLAGVDWLIAGSPTQQFRPTAALKKFLGSIPDHGLKGTKVAAFDTRLTEAQIEKSPPLPIFVKMFGYAAGRIAKQLRSKGGELVGLPEGFLVGGMEGPLVDGELERAAEWRRRVLA